MAEDEKKELLTSIREVVVDALEQVVFPKFDEIDKRFEQIDNRFDQVDRRFDGVETRLAELEGDMLGVKIRLKSVEEKIDALGDNNLMIRNHEKRIKKLEEKILVA